MCLCNDGIGYGGMNIEWIVIRGSGLVAYGLLAASTIWGLLVSTKLLGRAVKARAVTDPIAAPSVRIFFIRASGLNS